MAPAMFSFFQSFWPIWKLKTENDLIISNRLVRKLSVPDQTKEFIFAIREPETNVVVYLLVTQYLSRESALDAEYLIKEVRPDVVIAQVNTSTSDIIEEENCSKNDGIRTVPTSSIGVLRRCFTEKISKDRYESHAGYQVLQEIFGTGFCGHILAAKRASEEIDSRFILVESPYEKIDSANSTCDVDDLDKGAALSVQKNCLVPQNSTFALLSTSRRFCLAEDLQSQIKSAIPSIDLLISKANIANAATELGQQNLQPAKDFQAPSFAQSVYPLLVDLHDIFSDLPSIGKALHSAQTMLSDIDDGKPVKPDNVCDVYMFRFAVEHLRSTSNSAARAPYNQPNSSITNLGFSELPSEEKYHVLFSHTLKSHAKKHGPIVAIVDASCLAGIRKHWKSPVPLEVEKLSDLTSGCFNHDDFDDTEEKVLEKVGRRKLLADKPVVAVGAGATAVMGASSLSKVLPASTLVKLATFKVPPMLKFGVLYFKRTATIGFSKIFGSSNFFTQAVASAGAKTTTVKVTASAEKIRAVTHTIIASAERTSLLAMRTSFYEFMRRVRVRPVGLAPLATFSCSMAACTGLLIYGDGIECVAESIPSLPTIVSLGRGLESLNQASKEVRQTNCMKKQETLLALIGKLPKTQ